MVYYEHGYYYVDSFYKHRYNKLAILFDSVLRSHQFLYFSTLQYHYLGILTLYIIVLGQSFFLREIWNN